MAGKVEEIDPILRFPEVKRLTGLSRSSVYDLMGKRTFPKAIPLGGRSVGWLESEVLTWRRARIELRDKAA